MMCFRLSNNEFKKYLRDYFNCEYTREEDSFYEDYWRLYLNETRYIAADSFIITADDTDKYKIEIELYGQGFIYKPDKTKQIVLTLPEYIIKEEKERLEKSTMTNSTSATNIDYTTVDGVGYVDASKLAASHSTTSIWSPITVGTIGDCNICDAISTKVDKDYVDASIVATKGDVDEKIRGIEEMIKEIKINGDPFLSMNKDKIIFKNNTYIDVKRKEENNMFNFDFGPCKDSNIKMSTYGLAVKDAAGKWVSYDKANDSIVDVSPLTFGDGKYFYKMPVAIKDIKAGDVIIHEKRPMFVGMICKDGDLSVVDIMSAERKVIMPVKNMFGFNYYTRVASLMDMGGEAVQPSEDNPFGNPMMFALLSNEGGLDKLDPMMMFALMGGMGGSMKDMNPMMLALMLSNK